MELGASVWRPSLLVYWSSYRADLRPLDVVFQSNLTVAQTVVTAVGVILFMLALSTMKANPAQVRAALGELGWWFSPKSERVSGD